MTDTTDNNTLSNTINSQTFRDRIRLRFISAAIAVTTESTGVTSHANRLAFAGALFANQVDVSMLCMCVLSNATVRTSVLANASVNGGNAIDPDIDFQINSVLTGVAVSRAW